MSNYSGAEIAAKARKSLGEALGTLQADPDVPEDVMKVAENIAGAVGALFEAENASSEPDGKSSVKSALGTLSQTLALLQDVRGQANAVEKATETLASAMSLLFPLTNRSTRPPAPASTAPEPPKDVNAAEIPEAAPIPSDAPVELTAPKKKQKRVKPPKDVAREEIEANIGATTESNFYVGFSGEISDGGVFLATYNIFAKGTHMRCLITLPGNLSTEVDATVQFVRDPMDMASDAEPGMGLGFDDLDAEARKLILRFIAKRPPIFYDE